VRVATSVQGTVSEFDDDTGAGAVLLDDGARMEFPAPAFAASGLRLLRLGQRIRLERAEDGTVARVALVTMS
jgi:2-phospho-L-lactate/phosphoenolpyruvate guanylyltransferase